MYERQYIKPSVKLIDYTIDNIGFYLWLKSRQWVIEDLDGNKFMCDFELTPDWFKRIPDTFKNGSEVINKHEYLESIYNMNLQYMNTEFYVFEINGSCLFRDMLYNLNRVSQWAQSNRFLFSILDKNEVYNSKNYHISEEYKDIEAWETQFDKYMDKIHETDITDENRLEMPYSISSTFWIGIGRMLLTDFLSFIKFNAPFFYKVYGNLFYTELNKIGVKLNLSNPDVPASISQYLDCNLNDFSEGVKILDGIEICKINMGLILYSQFIRQADTITSGLLDQIIHKDVDEFKSIVFKGDTILKVKHVAHVDKVMSTVRTRLCSFAMSSGEGPCSWSHYIGMHINKEMSPEKLMNQLPCGFSDYKMINCVHHNDIKYRNEGKERSNCPCPLYSLNMKDAITKANRDKNFIGDGYLNLTKYLVNYGRMYEYEANYWTSPLSIQTDKMIDDKELDTIHNIIRSIELQYSKFDSTKTFKQFEKKLQLPVPENILNYVPDDKTCLLKGFAIDMIASYLNKLGHTNYVINFGNDIFCKGKARININDSNVYMEVDGNTSIFTSGNTSTRGKHIPTGPNNAYVTVVKQNCDPEILDNTIIDLYATKLFANETEVVNSIIKEFSISSNDLREIWFSDVDGGIIVNPTYIASPFFNEKQIEIRDAMESKFSVTFRPDKTESSLKYDEGDDDVVEEVVNDNINGINKSDFLVYPMDTDDLGTLFEVGHALSWNKPVIRYDHRTNTYTIIPNTIDIPYGESEKYLFDCNEKTQAIAMGYMADQVESDKICYMLGDSPDNIMLSVKYTHVEPISFDGNLSFRVIERDKTDRDK